MEKDDQLVFVKDTDKHSVNTLLKWMECFHIFVAIYSEKVPQEVPNLMAYAQINQNIPRSSGDKAAIRYDERFRFWHQQDPDSCPWQQKNLELFQEAMVQGLEFKSKTKLQPFWTPQAKHKYCFAYNTGSCPKGSSAHTHTCANIVLPSTIESNAPSDQNPIPRQRLIPKLPLPKHHLPSTSNDNGIVSPVNALFVRV